MPNRLLLLASRREGIRRFITSHEFTRRVADRFVAGEGLEDAMAAVRDLESKGILSILDYLGENIRNEMSADAAAGSYLESLDRISQTGTSAHVSVKPTQLGLDLGMEGCAARLQKICARASEVGTVVAIDMESHEYTDRTIDLYRKLRVAHDNVVLCLQAYLRRTEGDVDSLLAIDPAIRLCKGAYDEPREIAFDREGTRRNYKKILQKLIDSTSYTAIASHDDLLLSDARRWMVRNDYPNDRVEFQMLYGIRRDLQEALTAQGYKVRVYIPFGDQWYPYLTRRLAERPANLRFFLEALIRG